LFGADERDDRNTTALRNPFHDFTGSINIGINQDHVRFETCDFLNQSAAALSVRTAQDDAFAWPLLLDLTAQSSVMQQYEDADRLAHDWISS